MYFNAKIKVAKAATQILQPVRQAKETNGMLLENITLNPNPSFGSYKLGWCSFDYSTQGWCHTQTAGMTIPSGTIVPTAGSHLVSLLRTCLLPVGEAQTSHRGSQAELS